MSWRDSAACKELPPDLFFPPLFKDERSAPEPHYYNLGKLACEMCPIKHKCELEGIPEEFGLWGGTTPRERAGKPVKVLNKLLPREKVHMLAALGPKPDVPDLQALIRPHLEKRNKIVDFVEPAQ